MPRLLSDEDAPAGAVDAATAEDAAFMLWFVGPGDSPESPDRIPAGTFHPDPEGRSQVRFAAAVDPGKYPVLSVTAEAGDGDPSPTAPDVLRSAPRE